jgi:gas vesicle structural protein
MTDELEDVYEPEQLVLSDLINRVLDKGVVINADITISIADIDLIQLDLKVLISGLATLGQRARQRRDHLLVRPDSRP